MPNKLCLYRHKLCPTVSIIFTGIVVEILGIGHYDVSFSLGILPNLQSLIKVCRESVKRVSYLVGPVTTTDWKDHDSVTAKVSKLVFLLGILQDMESVLYDL